MDLTSTVIGIVIVFTSLTQPTQPSQDSLTESTVPVVVEYSNGPTRCSAPCVVDAQGNIVFCPC